MSTSTLPAELPRTRRAIPSLVWNKLLLSRTAHQEAHQPRRIPKLRTQPSSTFTILSSSSQATSSHISTFSHAPEQDELFASNIQACASNNAWEGKMLLAPEKSLNVPERVPASPPPLYDDPIHPWAMCARDPAAGSSSTSSSTGAFVIGDDDAKEKEEALPPYVCTVSRAGRVHIKKEMDSPQKKAKKRSWKQLYLSVWGTCLRVSKHEFKADREIEPSVISTFSMQDAEAGLATDYTKHKHVIRVRIPNGPQFLIRCETERDAVLWIDAMQASINVSCDLDTRPMPEFAFARRRRHHHHQHSRRRRGNSQQAHASSLSQ